MTFSGTLFYSAVKLLRDSAQQILVYRVTVFVTSILLVQEGHSEAQSDRQHLTVF